jgi:hypothetical protein
VRQIPEIIKSIGNALYSAGVNIVNKLWEGLKNKLGEVLDWFKDQLKGFSDMLPWNSPPRDPTSPLQLRVFKSAGENIGQEFLRGLQSTMPSLENAVAGMAETVAQGGSVTNNRSNNFYLTANYAHQDRDSLSQDVRFLNMLYGSAT